MYFVMDAMRLFSEILMFDQSAVDIIDTDIWVQRCRTQYLGTWAHAWSRPAPVVTVVTTRVKQMATNVTSQHNEELCD